MKKYYLKIKNKANIFFKIKKNYNDKNKKEY